MGHVVNVLFVCIGNICRSPTAEGVFKKYLHQHGLIEKIWVDSAGMSDYHLGQRAHPPTIKAAMNRHYEISSIARRFEPSDFDKFHYILPMDQSNYSQLDELARNEAERKKILPFISLCPTFASQYADVPDPYYGGTSDYEHVLDICEEGCQTLLKRILAEHFS